MRNTIKITTIFIGLFFILIFVYAEDILKVEITTGSVGNVFYNFEPIVISTTVYGKINFPEYAVLKTKILNYENLVVSENSMPGKKLTVYSPNEPIKLLFEEPITNLPVGYYTYKVVFQEKKDTVEKFIKFAIIKKSTVKDIANSPFAIDAFLSWRFNNPDDVKTACDLIKKIGVYLVRDRMSWNQVEKEKGNFDFGRYDKNATIQSECGLEILQVFHDTAIWASSKKDDTENVKQKYPPEDLRDVYNFFHKTASVFKGRVDYYEIWNEFDIPVFFLGKAEEYTAILKTAYLAIKDADSSAEVLFGSTTFGSGEIVWGDETFYDEEADIYIEKVFENGAIYFFDIFNTHHYGPVDGLVGKIKRNNRILNKYCGKGTDVPEEKVLWLTEMGSTSTKKMEEKVAESEILQAEYLVKAYALGISGGLKKFFYFCFPNFVEHNASFWGTFQMDEDGWQPKPAYAALANLVYTLSDAKYIGKIGTNQVRIKEGEAIVFKKKNNLVIVAWSRTGKDAGLKLSFKQPQQLIIRNIFGNEKIVQTDSQTNIFELKLTPSPVFIVGINEKRLVNEIITSDAKDYSKDVIYHVSTNDIMKELVIDLRSDKEDFLPGEFVTIFANLYNFSNHKVEGTFALSYPEEFNLAEGIQDMPVSLKPNERITKTFHFISQKSIPEGEYKIAGDFLLANTDKVATPGIRYLKIADPVKILKTNVIPYNQDVVNIEVKIKGNVSEEVSGKIYLNPPVGWEVLDDYKDGIVFRNVKKNQILMGVIKIKKSRQDVSATSNQFEIIAEVNGRKYSKKDYTEANAIYKSRVDMIMDGDLKDWHPESPFIMDDVDNYVIGKESVKSPEDLKGKFYWKWDEKNLYFSAEIVDADIKNDYFIENPWTGDGVEIFLDMRDKENLGKSYYDENVYQIFLIPVTDLNPKPFFKVWQPANKEFVGVECAFSKTKDGYIIEAKIPLINFGIDSFQSNREIGMDVTFDDIDNDDVQHRQMVWRGSPENWRDASSFQRMMLVE